MSTKTSGALALLIASIASPLQADYTSEVQVGYTNLDIGGNDIDIYSTGVTLYTSPLSYRGRTPQDEAAFFNRVGEVDMIYSRSDDSNKNVDTIGISYTHRASDNPHGFNASWLYSDSRASVTGYGAGYFYYLQPGFTVGGDIAVIDRFRDDQWTYRVSSKRLFSFERDRWLALDGGLRWRDYGNDNKYGVEAAASYFFNSRTSLGMGLGSDEDFRDYETRLALTRYFGENMAVDLGYHREYLKRATDPERFQIGGRLRF